MTNPTHEHVASASLAGPYPEFVGTNIRIDLCTCGASQLVTLDGKTTLPWCPPRGCPGRADGSLCHFHQLGGDPYDGCGGDFPARAVWR